MTFYLGSLNDDLSISFITRDLFPLKPYFQIPISLSLYIEIHSIKNFCCFLLKLSISNHCSVKEIGRNVCELQHLSQWVKYWLILHVKSISKFCLYLQNETEVNTTPHTRTCWLQAPWYLLSFLLCLLTLIWYILLFMNSVIFTACHLD